MNLLGDKLRTPLPGGPVVARAIQIALAGLGLAVVCQGLRQLPQMELSRHETALGLLLTFVLAMQFFLAAMIFPLTNCLLRRRRR